MGASWEAISVNDEGMFNNEILKKKNFRFPVKKLIRYIFWEKRVWNFKHCRYIFNWQRRDWLYSKNILSKPMKLSQNICLLNNFWYQRTNALAWAFQKIDLCGYHLGFPGGVPPKLCQNISLLIIYWYQENWHPRLSCSKNWFLLVHLGGSPGVAPPNYVKIFVCKISTVTKKRRHLKLSC